MPAIRGEASFETEDGATYHLVMDLNAFAEAEDLADMQIDQLLKAMVRPRLKHLRALLYGGLVARHPDISPARAMELIGECPGIGEVLTKAIRDAMPKPTASTEGKAQAPRGTGTRRKPSGPDKA